MGGACSTDGIVENASLEYLAYVSVNGRVIFKQILKDIV
jgi:hypothetical protein